MIAPLLGLVILLQVPTASNKLDELLQTLDEGQPLPTKVPRALARVAAARITPWMDSVELERLARVARAGRADDRLAPALLQVIETSGEASPAAVRALAEVPADELPASVEPPVLDQLAALAGDPDAGLSSAAAALLGQWAPPARARSLIDEWYDAERPEAIEALLGRWSRNATGAPAEWVRLVGDLQDYDGEPWAGPLGAAARGWALRDLAALDAAVERVGFGVVGPDAALLQAVGTAPLDDPTRWQRARDAVMPTIDAAAVDLSSVPATELSAAVRAATDLLLDELRPLLPSFALHGRAPSVRIAAIEALLKLGYRDAPTVDLLISLLDDPDPTVALAAFEAVRSKTGEKSIPGRKVLWEQWRRHVELPEGPPGEPEEWLAEQRKAQAQVRQLVRERYAASSRR